MTMEPRDKVEDVTLTEQWLQGKVGDISASGEAVVLIQGYPGTGFGRVSADRIVWRLSPDGAQFRPEYSFDVRLFGDKGEWHCWHLGGNQWKGRLANVWASHWEQGHKKRRFVLWGTRVEAREPDWACLGEDRGVRLWVPFPAASLPVRLPVWERVEGDPESGVAVVVDAMLRPLEGKR